MNLAKDQANWDKTLEEPVSANVIFYFAVWGLKRVRRGNLTFHHLFLFLPQFFFAPTCSTMQETLCLLFSVHFPSVIEAHVGQSLHLFPVHHF